MKNLIYLLLISALATFLTMSCTPNPPSPSELNHEEFISTALSDNLIGTSDLRDFHIYLPEGYYDNSSQSYPVIYLLHGLPGTDSFFIYQEIFDPYVGPDKMFAYYPDFPEIGFKLWIDALIEEEIIDPVILVMADANCAGYGVSWYSNSGLTGNFEDYIVDDLVSHIDNNYKTKKNKHGRAIIGFSYGGYGAFKLGIKHPDKFCAIGSHSAPLVLDQILYQIPAVLAENPDCNFAPLPSKPVTSFHYTMGAAWSPNPSNPPYYVDLPYECPSGDLIEDTWSKWLDNDPYTLLDTYGNKINKLDGIYIDCGTQDEFAFYLFHPLVTAKLDELSANYTYESFDGQHYDHMFERLIVSMNYCCQYLN